MSKKVAVILLSVVIFVAVCVLGVSTVYRVDEITLKVEGVSTTQEAKEEEQALQESLLKKYKGNSILFVQQKGAEEVLENYSSFRLTEFKRKFPNRLIIEVVEDVETYAVENGEDGYYILSDNGMVIGERLDSKNRLDGEDNLIIKGFSVTAQRGEVPTGEQAFLDTLAFCKEVSAILGGIRKNVVSIERIVKTPDGVSIPETLICFTMKEGVKIYVSQPETLTQEKAKSAIDKYNSLSVTERTKGAITLLETETAVYETVDSFNP